MTNRGRPGNGNRMKHQVALALAALVPLACQQPRGEAEEFRAQIRDSAGIRIVENERPPEGSRLGWRIGPEPSAWIGALEGDEPYMLHQAVDATKLPDGRIVVANAGSHELRVFDASGTHLASWGRQGEGPGEFARLYQVAPWPGDSVLAWDSKPRISVFDSGGDFGRSFSLQGSVGHPDFWPWPRSARRDGKILAVLRSEAVARDSAVLEIRRGDGAPYASFGTHPYHELALVEADLDRPFRGHREVTYGGRLVTGFWGDLVFTGFSARYEIRAFRTDGALARIVRRDHLGRVPAEADREFFIAREVARLQSELARAGPRIQLLSEPESFATLTRKLMEATPLAETFPAFSSVIGDAAGYLWVREYDFPREPRPAPLWTVFDPAGRVLGFVETPGGLDILEIGEDYLLGRKTDDLGLEYIEAWPLERSEG